MVSASLSPIELLALGDKGNYAAIEALKHNADKKVLNYFEKELKRQLSGTSDARWQVAITLALLARSGAWTAFHKETDDLYEKWRKDNPTAKFTDNPYHCSGGMSYYVHSVSYFTFLKEKFGLGRTTVYTYLEVVGEFAKFIPDDEEEKFLDKVKIGDGHYELTGEAKCYQFWQLIEMLSLSYEERVKIEPNWTRDMIRAYKKQLREKDRPKKEVPPAEQVKVEEKPLTEAQVRFSKFSKDDLIDEVVRLEGEVAKLTEQVETLLAKAYPYAKTNGISAKHELQGVIEKLLNNYAYEIRLHGKKQGIKPFAGVVAKSILSDYNADKYSGLSVVPKDEPVQERISV